jgi:putative ABC transport system substrate-binding protein
MRRRQFIGEVAGSAVWPLVPRAQQPDRVRRVEVLMGIANDQEGQARGKSFRGGMEQLGWIENHNVQFEYRWTSGEPERILLSAAELVAGQPDVLLSNSANFLVALRKATSSIPTYLS